MMRMALKLDGNHTIDVKVVFATDLPDSWKACAVRLSINGFEGGDEVYLTEDEVSTLQMLLTMAVAAHKSRHPR